MGEIHVIRKNMEKLKNPKSPTAQRLLKKIEEPLIEHLQKIGQIPKEVEKGPGIMEIAPRNDDQRKLHMESTSKPRKKLSQAGKEALLGYLQKTGQVSKKAEK